MEKETVVLRIFNEDYQIKTDLPKEDALALAETVNAKMMAIAQTQSALTIGKIAVLTCLQLAEELRQAQRDYQEILAAATDVYEERK